MRTKDVDRGIAENYSRMIFGRTLTPELCTRLAILYWTWSHWNQQVIRHCDYLTDCEGLRRVMSNPAFADDFAKLDVQQRKVIDYWLTDPHPEISL